MNTRVHLNALNFSKLYLRERLKTAQHIVDATCGNGHDSEFLANNSLSSAQIFAMDIQEIAITNTLARLTERGLQNRITVIHDSHVNLPQYVTAIDLAVFNLGYLPGGDHSLTTTAVTLMQTLEKLTGLLNCRGAIVIVAYPGHVEGMKERHLLTRFMEKLSQNAYNCACFKMLNQKNNPPELYIIEKW
ncbi:MAG: class I SAM-dependent methyltransferase [Negativicutes bacterium]|jgi:tRNA1(Val) A37 N6-methylase TrmN6